jgi:hypothetical protein
MERGEISYSNVRAITRVATPENEHYFLQIARHGTAHSGGERHQVVVHVSGETLTAGGGDRCEIEDGPAIAAEPALQRALQSRDKGCRFPGCTHKKYTDAHHIKHWARGGETRMSNLVTLCRFHDRKVHEGQVVVQVLDDGAIRFVQPSGESFDSRAHPAGDWRQLPAIHEQAGIHIDAKTAATRWDGGPIDYGIAIDVLMSLPRDVSGET